MEHLSIFWPGGTLYGARECDVGSASPAEGSITTSLAAELRVSPNIRVRAADEVLDSAHPGLGGSWCALRRSVRHRQWRYLTGG